MSKPNQTKAPGDLDRLHTEILAYVAVVESWPEEVALRSWIVRALQLQIHSLYPRNDAHFAVFGSSCTGLALPNSDIDLVVHHRYLDSYTALTQIYNLVRHNPEFIEMDLILTSRIPVLKFKSRLGGVKIDITVNNNDGPASTALVLEWVGKYPELRPIALILKAFIARLDFDSVYTGGLGGFALLNMIVSLLQQHSILASQKGNLGRILVQFFQTYGLDFDYDKFAISVRLKAYIPKPAEVVRTRYIPPPVVTTNAATSPSIPISATHSPSTPSPASGAAPGIKSYSSAAAKSPPAPATISYSSVATKPVSPTAPIIPSYSNAVAASPSTPASIKKIGVSNLEINDASNSSPIINVATYPTSTYSNPPLAQPPADYNLRLYIEDPTDTSNNVCKSTFRMGEIRAAFLSVFQSLSTSLRLDQIVWVDPEVTRVREKLRKDWLAYSTPPPRASHMSTHSTGTQTYKKGDDRDRSKHRGKPGVRAASSSGHRDAPVAVNDGVSLGRGRGGKNRLRRHSSPSRGGGVNYATVAGSGRGLRPATFGSVALGVERGRTGGREKKGRKDVDGIVEGVRGVSVSETL